MLIDCDTCTLRGTGCADCVVTVLLGAPPGWQGVDPVVVPMAGRPRTPEPFPAAEDVVLPPPGVVVEFDDVERRAVRALADSIIEAQTLEIAEMKALIADLEGGPAATPEVDGR